VCQALWRIAPGGDCCQHQRNLGQIPLARIPRKLGRGAAQGRAARRVIATRRLAAILAADVAGYSRLMGADEEGTLAALKAIRRELGDPKVKEYRGRIVKTTGDGLLIEFASAVGALRGRSAARDGQAQRRGSGGAIEFRRRRKTSG
jgi:class 3 adenylate cyclase